MPTFPPRLAVVLLVVCALALSTVLTAMTARATAAGRSGGAPHSQVRS